MKVRLSRQIGTLIRLAACPLWSDCFSCNAAKCRLTNPKATSRARRGFLLGLASSIMALATGWLASVLFRRDEAVTSERRSRVRLQEVG